MNATLPPAAPYRVPCVPDRGVDRFADLTDEEPGVAEGGAEDKPRNPRRGSETRRREFQVGVRLLPEEHAMLVTESTLTGKSAGELLRRAYFGTEDTE